jgi:histidinol-phosphatase (PHP family)
MGTSLPADGHVHSQFSWDAPDGSMEETCARAVELGLPAVAFTEHVDYFTWTVRPEDLEDYPHLKPFVGPDGTSLTPPDLDLEGYRESLARCRERFPSLRVITGVELGEPHWNAEAVSALLRAGGFERVLGSLHCLRIGDRNAEISSLYEQLRPAEVIREYLAEIVRLVKGSDAFGALAHIDYAVRYWPEQTSGPFAPGDFEDEFRHALRTLADAGRVLEVNTRARVHPELVRWWREEGGGAVTFGSDAHAPAGLAHGFAAATALVEAEGFRPGRHPHDYWPRAN